MDKSNTSQKVSKQNAFHRRAASTIARTSGNRIKRSLAYQKKMKFRKIYDTMTEENEGLRPPVEGGVLLPKLLTLPAPLPVLDGLPVRAWEIILERLKYHDLRAVRNTSQGLRNLVNEALTSSEIIHLRYTRFQDLRCSENRHRMLERSLRVPCYHGSRSGAGKCHRATDFTPSAGN